MRPLATLHINELRLQHLQTRTVAQTGRCSQTWHKTSTCFIRSGNITSTVLPHLFGTVTTCTCTLPSVHYTCRTSRNSTSGTYSGTATSWWTGACCSLYHSTSDRSHPCLWTQQKHGSRPLTCTGLIRNLSANFVCTTTIPHENLNKLDINRNGVTLLWANYEVVVVHCGVVMATTGQRMQ